MLRNAVQVQIEQINMLKYRQSLVINPQDRGYASRVSLVPQRADDKKSRPLQHATSHGNVMSSCDFGAAAEIEQRSSETIPSGEDMFCGC